jgi:WD40-like Beta Propeller Repeat
MSREWDRGGHDGSDRRLQACVLSGHSRRLWRRLIAAIGAACAFAPAILAVWALPQSACGATTLPDRRAWEMVSPAEKHGGLIEPLETNSTGEGGVIEASATGSALTYLSDQSLFGSPSGEANLSQVFATRTTEGWWSQDISTPHRSPTDAGVGQGQEYRAFSSDLAVALVEPFELGVGVPLSAEATERTPYVRDDHTGAYRPLVAASNVPEGATFGGNPEHSTGAVHFVAGTDDLSHVVLQTEEGVALTSTRVVGGGLYEWSSRGLTLVSVLPASEGGGPLDGELGHLDAGVRHAISSDGSRVFWEAAPLGEPRHLYVRDTAKLETERLDVVQAGGTGAGEAGVEFQTATPDGSRIYFTDTQGLTETAHAESGQPDLYMCELRQTAGGLTCGLTDLTVPVNPGEDANMRGVVLGTSEDGRYVYVVAKGVLSTNANAAGELATPGERNLYALHEVGGEWKTRFIATLSPEDLRDWAPNEPGSLTKVTSRVSPNGRYLAFMSQLPLTGYDNTDAVSGQPDAEVFLYDASTGRLSCASCNPRGVRPTGVFDSSQGLLVDPGGHPAWEGHWLAASLPGWTAININYATYQSRYLSNSGRLFFDSSDGLVPADINGKEDVYEYEPSGVGGCTTADEAFSERSGGCVALISSGTSNAESAFLDASQTGADVFFLTRASLTPEDTDGQFDIYDAHECTSASPCVSRPVRTSSAACTTGETCRPASFSQPSPEIPGSARLAGEGNVPAQPISPGRAGLLRVRVRGAEIILTLAVPAHGRISITGHGVRSAARTVATAGRYTLSVSLTPHARRLLMRKRALRVTISIRYVPTSGAASTLTAHVTARP